MDSLKIALPNLKRALSPWHFVLMDQNVTTWTLTHFIRPGSAPRERSVGSPGPLTIMKRHFTTSTAMRIINGSTAQLLKLLSENEKDCVKGEIDHE